MAATVNVDGQISGERDARISVFDHGFLYGEGVYEVLRTYQLRPFLFEPHLTRLRRSAERISLALPWTDAEILARINATVEAAKVPGEAYIRLLLTRGVGDLLYDPAACPTPTTVIIVKPLVDSPATVYEEGVTVALVPVMRNHPQSVSPAIKSNNLLNNALAMQQALARRGFEALMRNHRGELCECAQSNVFLVSNGVVRTPPLDAGLLAGITRAFVLELASWLGYRTREETLVDADLAAADEMFLTSTTKEIVPVVRVDDPAADTLTTIGSGQPGPITKALITEFRRRAHMDVRPVPTPAPVGA
jgi:branched-chain amino acid aminotransferase